MKQSLAALSSLALIFGAIPAWAVDYPTQEGYVYDGAGMLSSDEEEQLETRLAKFEAETTIGIAVATVESLGGVDSNNYAIELGNRWEIGDADQDNGVIIVIAKQERQLALWFADGYPRNWAEWTSQAVRDGVMVPQLKRGDYPAAIKNGVSSLIYNLEVHKNVNRSTAREEVASGSENMAPAAPTLTPEQKAEMLALENKRKAYLTIAVVLFPLSILLAILGVRQQQVRNTRRELQTEIARLIESLTHSLEQLPAAEQKLRSGYPESMWGPALSAINAAAMERLIYTDASRLGNRELTRLRDELRMANGGCERVLELLRRAERAREHAPRLLRELPARIEVLRAALHNPDVLPETSAQLGPLEVSLAELSARLPGGEIAQFDWAAFGDEVDKLGGAAETLQQRAAADIAQVREARSSVPRLMEEAQQKLGSLRALNRGHYRDVDASLDEMDGLLRGYYGYDSYDGLKARDIVYLLRILNNAMAHAQRAEQTYAEHTQPRSSGGSMFGSGSGGSSSWGSGGGGSSFGGSSGGGGGGSKW